MKTQMAMLLLVAAAAVIPLPVEAQQGGTAAAWQDSFDLSKCTLATTGRSTYFVLEPGHQLNLEGGDTKLQITVLDQTEVVDGVTTRVVEEREWKKGELYEIARNFYAICNETKDVFYFGEDVEFYKNGKVVNHDGSWRAGKNGNKPGLMMPGAARVGLRFYQELAPGIAMDRAEIVSVNETCETPAGKFPNCLKVKEQVVRDFAAKKTEWDDEFKYHAPNIGLVKDEELTLRKFGKAGQ